MVELDTRGVPVDEALVGQADGHDEFPLGSDVLAVLDPLRELLDMRGVPVEEALVGQADGHAEHPLGSDVLGSSILSLS